LTGIDLDDADSRINKLLPQGIGKRLDRSLSRTVDTTTRVGFATGDTANVDDVSTTTIGALLEDGKNGLSHVDQSSDVGGKHDVDILRVNFGGFGYTLDQTTISILSTLSKAVR
jgi:hypothetical protein